jgi:hypothetical protein
VPGKARRSGRQPTRLVVARPVEHRFALVHLGAAAGLNHHDAVPDVLDDAEIMRDEPAGEAVALLVLAQQRAQRAAHGCIRHALASLCSGSSAFCRSRDSGIRRGRSSRSDSASFPVIVARAAVSTAGTVRRRR